MTNDWLPNFADTTEGLIMADDKKENKENFVVEKNPNVGGGPKGPLLTIILIVNLVLMGALGFMQMKMHKKIESQPDINSVLKAAGIETAGGEGGGGEHGAAAEGGHGAAPAGEHGAPAEGGHGGGGEHGGAAAKVDDGKRADGTF